MRDDRQRLLDIREAIERIEKYASQGRETFDENELVQTWIIHHIEIIGEAARNCIAAASVDVSSSRSSDWWKSTTRKYCEGGMTTFTTDLQTARAQQVIVADDALTVDLTDGRTISVPLVWYPRLLHGTPDERSHWRFVGDRVGVHWPDLDEDISVENIVLGKPSGESQRSFQRWLEERAQRSGQP